MALFGMASIALRLPRRLPLRSMYPILLSLIVSEMAVALTSVQLRGHSLGGGEGGGD